MVTGDNNLDQLTDIPHANWIELAATIIVRNKDGVKFSDCFGTKSQVPSKSEEKAKIICLLHLYAINLTLKSNKNTLIQKGERKKH